MEPLKAEHVDEEALKEMLKCIQKYNEGRKNNYSKVTIDQFMQEAKRVLYCYIEFAIYKHFDINSNKLLALAFYKVVKRLHNVDKRTPKEILKAHFT